MPGTDKLIIQELLEREKKLLETSEETKARVDKFFAPLDRAVKGVEKPDRVLEDIYRDYITRQTAVDAEELKTRQTVLATSNKALTEAKNKKRWFVGSAIFAAVVTSPLIVAVAAVAVAVGVVVAIPAAAIYVFVKALPDTKTKTEKFTDRLTDPIKNFFLGKILGKIKKAIWYYKFKRGYTKLNTDISDAEIGVKTAEAQVRETEAKIKKTTDVIDREKKDLKQIIGDISKLEGSALKGACTLTLSTMGDIGIEILCRSLERLSKQSPAPVWTSLTLNLANCGLTEVGRDRLAAVIASLESDNLKIQKIDLTGTKMTKEFRQSLKTNLTITTVEYDHQKTSEDDVLKTTKQLVINRYLLKQPYDDLLNDLTPKQIKSIFVGDTPEGILASIKDASERKIKERRQRDLTRRYNCLQGHLGTLNQESFVKLKEELDSNFDLTFFDFTIDRYKGVGKLSDDVRAYVKYICSRNQLLELAKSFENKVASDEEMAKLTKIIDDVSPENYYAIKSLLVDRVFPFLNEQSRSKVNEHLKQKIQSTPGMLSIFAETLKGKKTLTDADESDFIDSLAGTKNSDKAIEAIEEAVKKSPFIADIIEKYMTTEAQGLVSKLRQLKTDHPDTLEAMLKYYLNKLKVNDPNDKTKLILNLLANSTDYDEGLLSQFIWDVINNVDWKNLQKKQLQPILDKQQKQSEKKLDITSILHKLEAYGQVAKPSDEEVAELIQSLEAISPEYYNRVQPLLDPILSKLNPQQLQKVEPCMNKVIQKYLENKYECLGKHWGTVNKSNASELREELKNNFNLTEFDFSDYKLGELNPELREDIEYTCSRNKLRKLSEGLKNKTIDEDTFQQQVQEIIRGVSPRRYYDIKSQLTKDIFPNLTNKGLQVPIEASLKQKRQEIPDVLSVFAEKFRDVVPTDADVTEFMEILAAMPQKSRQDAIEKAGKKGPFTSLIIQRYMTSQEPQELMIKLRDLNKTNPELLKAMLRYHLQSRDVNDPNDKTDLILELLYKSVKYDEKILSEFINKAINNDAEEWKNIQRKVLRKRWESEYEPSAQKTVAIEKLSVPVEPEPEPEHKLAVAISEPSKGEQVVRQKWKTSVSSTLCIVSALGIPPGTQQKPEFSKMTDKALQEWLMEKFECLKPKFKATEEDLKKLEEWMKENPYLKEFHHNLYPLGQRPSTKTCDFMDLWCQTNGALKSYKNGMDEFIKFFTNTKYVKPDNYNKVLEEIGRREPGFLIAVQKYMGSENVLTDLQKLAKDKPKAFDALLRYNLNSPPPALDVEYKIQLVYGLLKLLDASSKKPKEGDREIVDSMRKFVFSITSGAGKNRTQKDLDELLKPIFGEDFVKHPVRGIKLDVFKAVEEAREKTKTPRPAHGF